MSDDEKKIFNYCLCPECKVFTKIKPLKNVGDTGEFVCRVCRKTFIYEKQEPFNPESEFLNLGGS